jgi:hypothetical protein
MANYIFRDVVPLRGKKHLDPQKVGEIIAALPAEDRPEALWRAAKERGHYLHSCYEWNTQRAAEAHWRSTSLGIIRSIYVVSDSDPDEETPAFISITADTGRRFYEPTEIVGSLSLQVALMKAARRDLDAFRKRYRVLGEICGLVAAAQERLDEAIKRSTETGPSAADAA